MARTWKVDFPSGFGPCSAAMVVALYVQEYETADLDAVAGPADAPVLALLLQGAECETADAAAEVDCSAVGWAYCLAMAYHLHSVAVRAVRQGSVGPVAVWAHMTKAGSFHSADAEAVGCLGWEAEGVTRAPGAG